MSEATANPLPHILVVDDEAELREMLRGLLQSRGFQITLAANAQEALEICRKHNFDLILTDERMPGSNGIEFAFRLADIYSNRPPIALMTGHHDVDSEQTRQFGITKVFRKPFVFRELISYLEETFGLTKNP